MLNSERNILNYSPRYPWIDWKRLRRMCTASVHIANMIRNQVVPLEEAETQEEAVEEVSLKQMEGTEGKDPQKVEAREMEAVNVEVEHEIMEEINPKITNFQMILQMVRYQGKLEKIIQI